MTQNVETKKVLLVDDSVTTLLMERVILAESPKLNLITAANGAEALQLAREQRPDLILMDTVMPHMNGIQACRAIRALDGFATVPIILVTTPGEQDDALGGYASGCTGYITKPINPAELTAVVEAHLGRERDFDMVRKEKGPLVKRPLKRRS
jgi:DNA-binding response OmpR family regulator